MLFNSIEYMFFFPIVLLLYYLFPKKIRYLWLLASSYYFYMCWNAKYALLLFSSTMITYLAGLLMEEGSQNKKKIILTGCFLFNLGILFFFKYANFSLAVLQKAIQIIKLPYSLPMVNVLLPVGISFFTFQALGYTMDVYRGTIKAEKNFFMYALFVSFFPQLVAGPIERSKNLLSQLRNPQKICFDHVREGLLIILWGFFLKIVIADRIAIFVDTVYNDYLLFSGWYIVIATILFAIQIYCDFAGYSTIAKGSAKMLGITLMENFDAPYFSTSIADFWRRWHISLTSWFKDYLYFPLGGSRRGKVRKYFNKITVFLVSGLWHGASGAFIIWGLLNGLYQVIEELTQKLRDKGVKLLHLHRDTIGHKLLCGAVTFAAVDFSWIFFRAGSLSKAMEVIRSMCSTNNLWILFDGSLYDCGLTEKDFAVLAVSIVILGFADAMKRKNIRIAEVVKKQDYWFRWIFMAASIVLIMVFGIWGPGYNAANFIYFQF